ncbi:MAG: hypothetical protein K9N35_03320 [Candidatus Marinimicrobia bacterium]|nr:hypothetical protein [Candidatus Neomarinimicrobiota bacterium]
MVILFVILFVAVAISITWYAEKKRTQALSLSPIVKKPSYQFKVENLAIPAGVYFSPTHSWAHMETNGQARVGVDSFIQGLTGTLTDIEVPAKGTKLSQGDPMFQVIHEDKRLTITAPISGEVKGINSEALQNMKMVHRDPYSHGWLVEMMPNDWESETQKLYIGDRTLNWLKTEVARIRDFFAYSFAPSGENDGLALLQDGGDIGESALAFAGKGLWGSFQKLILDQANLELKSIS